MMDFDDQLAARLKLYGEQVNKKVHKAVKQVAEDTKKKVRELSPVRTGRYKAGWRIKETSKDINNPSYTLYNTKYRLTHLLEKGHAKRGGGFVAPRVHIRPAEQFAEEELTKKVKEAVRNDA